MPGSIGFKVSDSTSTNNDLTTPHIGNPVVKANANDAMKEFKGEKVNVSKTPVNIIVKPAKIPNQDVIE